MHISLSLSLSIHECIYIYIHIHTYIHMYIYGTCGAPAGRGGPLRSPSRMWVCMCALYVLCNIS